MRWLFVFILIALFANAYDAGRHVFGVSIEHTKSGKMAGMDCCPPEKTTKAGSAATSCHYCCSGLFASAQTFDLNFADIGERYSIVRLVDLRGHSPESLFRPPRYS